MLNHIVLACVCVGVLATATHAQVTIRVLRKDNGKPVVGARVKFESYPGRVALGKKGKTNENGIFISEKLPNGLTKIYIHIDPLERELEAVIEIHPTNAPGIIIIRISLELP